TPPTVIKAVGPGKRILGIDVSVWQHPKSSLFPNGAPIDFKTAYKNGVRFVIIKASDGRDNGHNGAAVWYAQDRHDAQAAGIFTGFYHFAYFPQTTVKANIIADALAQADKAIWRLASVGGYNNLDLPYALDVEEWCLATNDNGSCMSRVTKANATLWVKTWLQAVASKTGRKPFVYSNASFLENYLNRDTTLRTYPLWIAHAGLKPADATNYPGMKAVGTCFITAWTLSSCQPQWSIWQYGIEGNEAKYGIPGGNVDVNVFSGTAADLISLTQGVWQPAPGDFLPFNETSTTTVSALSYSLTTLPLTFTVDVRRITGGPVVSGTVAFQLLADASGVPPIPAQITSIIQSVKRTASGTWNVSVTGLPAGTWIGQVAFRDSSGVHAPSSAPLVFSLIDPNPPVVDTSTATTDTSTGVATPTPTPSTTPSPTVTPTP
ncbi:MAG: glycoside hydrolase family 25 protein, partial [Candidatus Nanopelagicales bacterium]